MAIQCACVWRGERCPNDATQEDGLCDWCAFPGKRRNEDLRRNPKAIEHDGKVFLGGRGELHDLGEPPDAPACWYENSGRTVDQPGNRPLAPSPGSETE